MAGNLAGTSKKTMSKSCPTLKTAPTWAVQCTNCKKWRVIPSQDEYEDIRRHIVEVPFTCQRKARVSCNDPSDVEPGNGSLWGLDKPNLPKSPPGFTRRLSLRNNMSRLEVYYETPSDKILRRPSEVAHFLAQHPEYKDVSPADFDFKPPMISKNTNATV